MTDNERIAALRRQAEGRGAMFGLTKEANFEGCENSDYEYYLAVWNVFFMEFDDLDTAATLLGALDPEAVVVRLEPHVQTNSCGTCVFYYDCDEGGLGCVYDWHKYHAGGCTPGPRCPDPCDDDHEWVLVKRRKVKR